MQSQKDSQIPMKILFMGQGKLTNHPTLTELCGYIKLMDSSGLACITGYFEKGLCEQAQICSLNPQTIRNIPVEIRNEGSVWMGGAAVEELQMGEIMYSGGYRGYQRSGYAKTLEEKGGRVYDQHCLWDGNREKGMIVKEHRNVEDHLSSLIIIEDSQDMWIETKVSEINGKYIKKIQNSEGLQQAYEISKQEHDQVVSLGIKHKKQLIDAHNIATFMSAVKQNPLKWIRYDQSDLLSARKSKLSDNLCEVYLSNLFCRPESHCSKRTAILSLNLIDLLYQRSEKMDVSAKIEWLMLPFKRPFNILGGFWQRIIIPLVLTSHRHYSFAVIELNPLRYTYYDSASFHNSKLYERLIKDFIIEEEERAGIDNKSQRPKIRFQICLEFPQQLDDVSCGYYMLEGIEQILKFDKITFQNQDLPQIKQKILQKLRSLM